MQNKATEQLIKDFYTAFQNLDAAGMKACYHPEATFWDPGFGELKGPQVWGMWEMLCAQAKNFKLTFSNIYAEENSGRAHWEAIYDFSRTGRKVHNKIDASFTFKDGKIFTHKDQFNLHAWAKQALGWKGWLLGGTNFFQNKLQEQTNGLLKRYLAKQAQTAES